MDEPACLLAALAYARRGWPTFPLKPQSKEPLTRHGVNDATTDEAQLRAWWKKWPQANVAIACGHPGPDVLDVDDLIAGRDVFNEAALLGGPDVATARGRQLYGEGSSSGTINLGYGELRGRGSYVVAPPSIHPSGKVYTWIVEPNGRLPRLPDGLRNGHGRTTAGVGELKPRPLIAHGERHDALKDFAVRQVRGGILDQHLIEVALKSYFEAACEPLPKPRRDEFAKHAAWAIKSKIADRERMYADFDAADRERDAADEKKGGKAKKQPTGLERPPRGDAPLKEHRAYVGVAGGWGDRIDVKTVVRGGQRPADWLEITLTNGQAIWFERQEHVATRGHWMRVVTMYTNGIANPVALNEIDGAKVLRSLCILADAPAVIREAEDLWDAVGSFVARCEAVTDHDLSTPSGRYEAIAHCRARESWDPFHDDDTRFPVLLVDAADSGGRYVRAGELRAWLSHEGFKLESAAMPGRMTLIGLAYVVLRGREGQSLHDGPRSTNHSVFYRLPSEAVAK
jgi:hypothetical protein